MPRRLASRRATVAETRTEPSQSLGVVSGVEWSAMWTRLRADPNDREAWDALAARVRVKARARLLDLGDDVVEDVVADTCATVVMDLDASHGPETFGGFVLGKFLNVVKGAIRLASMRRESLDAALDIP